MISAASMRELAGLSLTETIDAEQVLSAGALTKSVEPAILSARARLTAARAALEAAQQLQAAQPIDELLRQAVGRLRAARSALVDPGSLPPTFRN